MLNFCLILTVYRIKTYMTPIKLLLVDDHNIFLESMSLLLKNFEEIQLLGGAVNGKEAISFLEREEIDIVLTDITMPLMNGIELISHIRQNFKNVKVIVLSMSDNPEIIKNSINNGVAGYLYKTVNKEELLNAIKIVYKGDKYFSNDVIYTLSKINEINELEVNKMKLTDRELEVMKHILNGEQSQVIADKLFISFNTVETHRKSIYKKLNVNSSITLFQYALKNGFLD